MCRRHKARRWKNSHNVYAIAMHDTGRANLDVRRRRLGADRSGNAEGFWLIGFNRFKNGLRIKAEITLFFRKPFYFDATTFYTATPAASK
jgi:hypothetical protein